MTGAAVIDGYLGDLAARLRGPSRVKGDLLAEARDGLTDAADAYRDAGYPDSAAERRAVDEFGDLDVVAREYQAELGVASGVHALRTVVFALPAMYVVWELTRAVWFGDWSQLRSPTPDWYRPVALLNDYTGSALAGLSVLALVVLRFVSRRAGSARIGRGIALLLAVLLGVHVTVQFALLGATGLVEVDRLFLSVPCALVGFLSILVSVRLVVLARRSWTSCVTIVA
ncbi:permease prefix domain 1-containing protein [Amycolatopsis anabasis]|uniref:permease prefix domain 1-containing protein n=1 Tax=Amycolatopsis anabasis TaxID=1840409 RepID=UPI001FEAC8C0|nr:permease prefix domain 1-containing protein [Amycolatopsis anabasis]